MPARTDAEATAASYAPCHLEADRELLRAALADPAVRQEFANTGGRSRGSTPDELRAFVNRKWPSGPPPSRLQGSSRNEATMTTTVIRAADLAAYSPANHTGTSNVRVIGPETVGATALEVLVGTIVKSHGASRTRIRTWSNAPT